MACAKSIYTTQRGQKKASFTRVQDRFMIQDRFLILNKINKHITWDLNPPTWNTRSIYESRSIFYIKQDKKKAPHTGLEPAISALGGRRRI